MDETQHKTTGALDILERLRAMPRYTVCGERSSASLAADEIKRLRDRVAQLEAPRLPVDWTECGEVLSAELERQELSGDHDETWSNAVAAASVIEAYLRMSGREEEAGAVARAIEELVQNAE